MSPSTFGTYTLLDVSFTGTSPSVATSLSTGGTATVAVTVAQSTSAPENDYHLEEGVPVLGHFTVTPSAWPQWSPSLLSTATTYGAVIVAALVIAPVTAFYVARDRHRWVRPLHPDQRPPPI